MSLFDAGLTASQFEVDAIDISRRTLARAQAARYSVNAFRNADLGFRDRWFRRDGGQWVVDPKIVRQVRFAWANLLDDAFAAGRGTYDVIFCRNLLIYLTPAARRQVERQLERLLAADGLLVLGAAEPPIMQGDWIPAGTASLFALRRGIHAKPVKPSAPAPRATAPARATSPATPPTPVTSHPAANAPDTNGQGSLESILAEADRLANAGQIADALAWCERHRAGLAPSPQLFFLMGMLYQSAGDFDRAEGSFHKTLYLDASHEEALLALALLARQRGDMVMAEKYRLSAARAMGRKEEPR
jgi:chemotaxis protein methyltransferase WspC